VNESVQAAPPPHVGQVETREPDAAQHVDLEEATPTLVRDLFKGFRLEDAHVVHENLDARMLANELSGSRRDTQIAGKAKYRRIPVARRHSLSAPHAYSHTRSGVCLT
jgi:hypothetical protein